MSLTDCENNFRKLVEWKIIQSAVQKAKTLENMKEVKGHGNGEV